MELFIGFTQFILYVLYALVIGHVVMQFVKDENKPEGLTDKRILLVSLLGIILLSFAPIAYIVYIFKGNMGVLEASITAIKQFHVGKAWMMTSTLALLQWVTIQLNGSKHIQAINVFLLVLVIGYGSHASSEAPDFWSGFFTHSVHFLAVSIWVGVLIQVAWFSKNEKNWSRFLNWFHPLALGCLVLITVSGIVLMTYVMNNLRDYPSTWVLSYGQMLLLKHLSIIPVLVFAYLNGIWSKKSSNDPNFNPRPWVKAESIVLLFTFSFTGIMGNQTPPHTVKPLQDDSPFWVDWFAGANVTNSSVLTFGTSAASLIFLLMSICFIGMMFTSFKKVQPRISVLMALGFIVFAYVGCMFMIHV